MNDAVKDDGDDGGERRRVLEALSDMYLDTDVATGREHRATVLAASSFALEALERVLVEEVHPVVRTNLLAPAGVWTGFDLDWLESRIERRRRSPLRWLHALDIGRFTAPRAAEWRATRRRIEALRREAPPRRRGGL